MKVGKAKFGSNKKFFKIEDGDNVYRILPPLGNLADKGMWSKYYRVEWGYKNSEGRTKLFQDCRQTNRETGMVEIESAAHLKREQLKQNLAKVSEDFKAGKATKEDVIDARRLTMKFNVESKHHVNAVNLKGEIGLLKLGHRAKLSLDAQIKKLKDEGVDALGIENGVYFNIYRSGTGRDTVYQVSIYTEKVEANVNGERQLIEKRKTHTMDEAFISRLDSEAFELDDMYPAPTSEEIEAIVNGGPEVLDQVISKYKGSSSSRPKPSVEDVVKKASEPVDSIPAKDLISSEDLSTSAPSAQEEIASTTSATVTTEAPVQQQAAPAAAPETKVETSEDEMSDEDFLKSIGAM